MKTNLGRWLCSSANSCGQNVGWTMGGLKNGDKLPYRDKLPFVLFIGKKWLLEECFSSSGGSWVFCLLMCFPIHALYSRVLMLYKDQLVKAHTPSLQIFYKLLWTLTQWCSPRWSVLLHCACLLCKTHIHHTHKYILFHFCMCSCCCYWTN